MYACIEDKIINDKTIGGKIDFDIKKEKIAAAEEAKKTPDKKKK